MEIIALVESAPHQAATEALYFCIRALKQARLAGSAKKDYFHDTETSRPSETSVALAKHVLQSICQAESVAEIEHISPQKLSYYLTQVARASDLVSARGTPVDLARGSELLRRMREVNP